MNLKSIAYIAFIIGALALITIGLYFFHSDRTSVPSPTSVLVEPNNRSRDLPEAGTRSTRHGVQFTPRAGVTEEDWRPTPVDLEKLHEILPSGLRSVQDVLAVSNYFIEKRIAEQSSQPIKRPDEILLPLDATPDVEMSVLGRKADANARLVAGLAPFNDLDAQLKVSVGPEKYGLFKRFERTEELANNLSMLEERQKGDNHRAAAGVLLDIADGKGTFDQRRNDLTGPLGQDYVREHEKALRYWATDRLPRCKVIVNHGE